MNAAEETIPGPPVEQVIHALVGADDGVEPGVQFEAGHIGQVQRNAGKLPTGHDQHARRYIQAAHLVFTGQHRGDGTGSAGHVQEGRRAAMTPLEDAANKRRLPDGIAGHDVIVRSEQIVG